MDVPGLYRVPNEVLDLICRYLETDVIIRLSLVSSRLHFAVHNSDIWRRRCYEGSQAAARRRRDLLFKQNPVLQSLADSIRAVTRPESGSAIEGSDETSQAPASEEQYEREEHRALLNWDPSFPADRADFYQEFIHRHAPIKLSWLHDPSRQQHEQSEAKGAAVLYNDIGKAERVYAPLDDGNVAVWDTNSVEAGREVHPSVRQLSRTRPCLLTGSKTRLYRTAGIVECVALDHGQKRGFFAADNSLLQLDLNTLQSISNDNLGSPIHAISEADLPTPLSVGTAEHIHLVDPRDRTRPSLASSSKIDLTSTDNVDSNRGGLLLNLPRPSFAELPQPGPLSILHLPSSSTRTEKDVIWVAGRFSSILQYDRRFFPRVSGFLHSGARISCLTSLPYPLLYCHSDLSPNQLAELKKSSGTTIIAAGEYKGKGALELYGLSHSSAETSQEAQMPAREVRFISADGRRGIIGDSFLNRHTASSSKLLSVAPHGLKLAYSDGNAKLKWIERNGFTPIREFSIDASAEGNGQSPNTSLPASIFSSGPSVDSGDIVQKIMPSLCRSRLASSGHTPGLHEDNLFVWTGDGRLGMVGFGKDCGWDDAVLEAMVESAEEEAKVREERQYGLQMRLALQRHADEARFMTGLGLPMR